MSTELRVLIVEDSEQDTALLLRELRKGGYTPLYERVDTPYAMRAALEEQKWDVVICDFVMPQFSGLEALRVLQETSQDIPFIVVSGQIGEDTAVEAMRSGAHDYIMKENLKRLVPAIQRELVETDDRRQRRIAEEELMRTAERLTLVTDAIQDVFWISTPGVTEMVYVSPAYEKIWGRSRESLYREPSSLLETVHSEDRDIFLSALKDHAEGKLLEYEYRIIRPDGSIRWVRDRSFPVYDRAGQFTMMTGIVTDITEEKHTRDNLEYYVSHVTNAQEEERRRIARELHDQTGQSLTVLNLLLSKVKRSITQGALSDIDEAQKILRELLEQVRNLCQGLYPSSLESAGLIPTLSAYFDEFAARSGIDINFQHSGLDKSSIPHQVRLSAFRIVQEALTNIVRHADVHEAQVQLCIDENYLVVQIEDKGRGFDPSRVSIQSSGIRGMTERARVVSGTLTVQSAIGTGTQLCARLPLSPRKEPAFLKRKGRKLP